MDFLSKILYAQNIQYLLIIRFEKQLFSLRLETSGKCSLRYDKTDESIKMTEAQI